MIRLTKQADYAILLLIRFAEVEVGRFHSARDLAAETHLPFPIVSKVLKALSRGGLLISHRGVHGGYQLAAPPERISVADIIRAIEGPIALTECQTEEEAGCVLLPVCASRSKWSRINTIIENTLDGITLAQMARPLTREEMIASGEFVAALSADATAGTAVGGAPAR